MPAGPASVMPYTWKNALLRYARVRRSACAGPIGPPPYSHARTLDRSNAAKPSIVSSGSRYDTGAPKYSVTRSRSMACRKRSGWYSRSSTTVPPAYSVPPNQLLSGDECQIGIAISVRSWRPMPVASAACIAASVTVRWLCTQPFGWPVVPDV